MVDDERVDDGRRMMIEHATTLEAIERQYRVDPAVVVAIWGIESNFGRGTGSFDVLRSLATLSCHGRRQAYFRGEFLAALRAVQKGDIDGDRFLGSWAGAFGQVQFMPGSYEWLAVDFDRDGRRDILHNVGDALASAANFLRRRGWQPGAPWGIEVRLPNGFNARGEGRRALAIPFADSKGQVFAWLELERGAAGAPFGDADESRLRAWADSLGAVLEAWFRMSCSCRKDREVSDAGACRAPAPA